MITMFMELERRHVSGTAAKSLQSCPTLATPWTAAYQAPPSMGFSRQKYWSGAPLPSLMFQVLSLYKKKKNPKFCSQNQKLHF